MLVGLSIPILIGRLIGGLLGLTIHEFAHAWTAVRLGDTTPIYQSAPPTRLFGGRLVMGGRGRLTLDPRAHIDPLGFLLLMLVGFGWAHPVPVSTRNFYPNEQRGLMLVALAGPITNLVQAFVFGGLLRFFLEIGLFSETSFMAEILASIVILNIVLFLFNLVPLSPLDGWKILLGLLPAEQSWNLRRYEQESTFALVLILMVGVLNPNFNVIWLILGPIARLLFSLTTGGVVFY